MENPLDGLRWVDFPFVVNPLIFGKLGVSENEGYPHVTHRHLGGVEDVRVRHDDAICCLFCQYSTIHLADLTILAIEKPIEVVCHSLFGPKWFLQLATSLFCNTTVIKSTEEIETGCWLQAIQRYQAAGYIGCANWCWRIAFHQEWWDTLDGKSIMDRIMDGKSMWQRL